MQYRAGSGIDVKRFGDAGFYALRIIAMSALQGKSPRTDRFHMDPSTGRKLFRNCSV
jgi:hypothetical protein